MAHDEEIAQLYADIRILQKKKAAVYKQWAIYTAKAYIIAAGMAGATMLFLMHTTPTEVMDMAAKGLDAVTPLT